MDTAGKRRTVWSQLGSGGMASVRRRSAYRLQIIAPGMVFAPRRWYRNPLSLLIVVAALSAFVIQSGELGTSDTSHRLQTTHSWWTSEPPVFPKEYPEFGIHGRGGKLYSWYGMGQSLLMFPADVIGTGLERLPIFVAYNNTDPTVRAIFVSYATNILVNVLTTLVCFRFLCQLGFSVKQSVAGVLVSPSFCCHALEFRHGPMSVATDRYASDHSVFQGRRRI